MIYYGTPEVMEWIAAPECLEKKLIVDQSTKLLECFLLKRTTLYKWLSSNFTGITFLQEVHSTLDSEQSWSTDFTGYVFYSHGTSNARGVCILIPTVRLKLSTI